MKDLLGVNDSFDINLISLSSKFSRFIKANSSKGANSPKHRDNAVP